MSEACDAALSEIEVDRTNSDEPIVVAFLLNGAICVHFLCEHVFPTLTNYLSFKRLFGDGWYFLQVDATAKIAGSRLVFIVVTKIVATH